MARDMPAYFPTSCGTTSVSIGWSRWRCLRNRRSGCGRSNRRKTAYQPNPSPRTKSNVPQAQALVEGWMPEPVRHDGSHHTFFSAASKSAIRRSEEHTSELQSLMRSSYAVFCLKKKTQNTESH